MPLCIPQLDASCENLKIQNDRIVFSQYCSVYIRVDIEYILDIVDGLWGSECLLDLVLCFHAEVISDTEHVVQLLIKGKGQG